jgi:hypothetical protein
MAIINEKWIKIDRHISGKFYGSGKRMWEKINLALIIWGNVENAKFVYVFLFKIRFFSI